MAALATRSKRGGLDARTTARLALRRPGESDRADLRSMHRDPQVMATLGGVRNDAASDELFDWMCAHWEEHGFGWWIARDPQTEAFLGRGGLRRVHVAGRDEVEVGYGFLAHAWGRGLATELARYSVRVGFEELGLPEIVSFTLTTNEASQRVMQKTGLRYERPITWADLPHVLYRLRASE